MKKEEVQKMIDEAIQAHSHDGNQSQQIAFDDLYGMVRTIDVAADLTNALATTPRNIYEQILIDITTATKRLYIYDVTGKVWYKVTIA